MSKLNKLGQQIRNFADIEPVLLESQSDYQTLRNRSYKMLQDISLMQAGLAANINQAKNVLDVPLYLKKVNAQLKALNDCAGTIDKILKHSAVDAQTAELMDELERKLVKIESELKRGSR